MSTSFSLGARSVRFGLGIAIVVAGAVALVTQPVRDRSAGASVVSAGDLTGGSGPVTEVCLIEGRSEAGRTVRVSATVAERLYRRTRSYAGVCADYGPPLRLGDGRVRTFSQLAGDRPASLGFVFDRGAFSNLPTEPTDGKHCYDTNGDGTLDPQTECVHEHEYMLQLPRRYLSQVGGPFTWAMLNWDPVGHAPEQIYGVPHFDLHFYIQEHTEAMAIGTGPCGGMNLVDCEDYARARKPVPERYLPAGYVDIDAVVPGMGNHLGDPAAPEFNGQPFTHTFMYGAYDGEITFYEPMISKSWLEELAAGRVTPVCQPLKLPAAWQPGGWYPTRYCIGYRPNRQEVTVSMTDFVHRQAS